MAKSVDPSDFPPTEREAYPRQEEALAREDGNSQLEEEQETGAGAETEQGLAFWFWNPEAQEQDDQETRLSKFLQCAGYIENPPQINQAKDVEQGDSRGPDEEEAWSLSSEYSSSDLTPEKVDSQLEVEDFLEELHAYDSEGSESERFTRPKMSRKLSKHSSRAVRLTKTETWDTISESEENDEWKAHSEFGEPFPQFISRMYRMGNIDISSENVKDDYYERLSSDSECEYIRGSDEAENSSGWSRLCFLPDPWAEARYPTPQFISREELANEYVSKSLNMTMIASGLGNLTVPPGHSQYTCTKLQLQGLGIESINQLACYKYLQYIDISMNSIVDLSPIWNIQHLIVLDASNNLVTEYTFGQPNKTLFLTYLNLSQNNFTAIPNLEKLWSLKHLNLSQNKIQSVQNLESLTYLEYLDLSSNELESITNLKNTNLIEVNFSRNQLKQWDAHPPYYFKHLEKVNIAHNSFATLKTFKNMYSLRVFNGSKNEFSAMSDFDWLRTMPRLEELRLYGNQLMNIIPDARRLIIFYVPSLKKLDDGPVTSMERVSCQSLYSKLPYGSVINDDTLHFYHSRSLNPEDGWEHWKPAGDHPAFILLVSYTGTNSHEIAWRVFQRNPYKVKVARMVTTLPKFKSKDGFLTKLPYMKYVSAGEFYKKEENGDFVVTYLQLGYHFGLESTQLEVRDRVLIAAVNMSGALRLAWRGFFSHNILVCAENLDILNNRLYSWFKKTNIFKNDSHTQIARAKLRKHKSRKPQKNPSWRDQINIPYRSISGAGISAINEIKDRRLSRSRRYRRDWKKRLHRTITSVRSSARITDHKKKMNNKMQRSYKKNFCLGYGYSPSKGIQKNSHYFWDPIFVRNTEQIFKPGLSRPVGDWCKPQDHIEKKRVGFAHRQSSATKSGHSPGHSMLSSETKDTGVSMHTQSNLNEQEEFLRFVRNVHRKRQLYRQMNRENPGFFQLYLPSDDLEEAARMLNNFVNEKYEKLQSRNDREILFSDSPHFEELVMSHINEYVDELYKTNVLPDSL